MLRIFLSPARRSIPHSLDVCSCADRTFRAGGNQLEHVAVEHRESREQTAVPADAGAARTTTVKSSKSNTSDRMGGGAGHALRATTVKSSKSNTSDRIGSGAPGSFGLGR